MSDLWTLKRLAAEMAEEYGHSALDSWMRLSEWLAGAGLPSDDEDIERFSGLIGEVLDD